MFGSVIIDMKAVEAKCKAKLGTEEEPFEGPVPIEKVEAEIVSIVNEGKKADKNAKFLFDSYINASDEDFLKFSSQFGLPDFVTFLSAEENYLKERWLKKNETEEFPEDQMETLKADMATNKARRTALKADYESTPGRVRIVELNTGTSLESTVKELQNKVSPKVVLVNHEKKLGVDTTCANLAIKYNMVYISAYQVIKQHIEENSEYGKKLIASKKPKQIEADLHVRDEFKEAEYSPVHFDLVVVMNLLKDTIYQKRTN